MDTLSYKTLSANKQTANKQWFIVDAENQILGRMSSKIAKILRGKYKTNFTPHADCGDYVIVINSNDIRVTGKKSEQKIYRRHSGRPGGLKIETFEKLQDRIPERILEKAVKGMLPKGPLGRDKFKNLKVYKEDSHPHASQNPELLVYK